ncbi:hypothetical protein GWI33_002146 [Rhynchophorus ferrugineus]|uniref:Uncharacterized protein n=1 Tax=Rhynchophorus ferrugineus TaxID=354439 RepID=A0A834MHQ2_RHYFE|nr:hypothetical protein GWI33_002146 [Rhynchophorus ferrugineus]
MVPHYTVEINCPPDPSIHRRSKSAHVQSPWRPRSQPPVVSEWLFVYLASEIRESGLSVAPYLFFTRVVLDFGGGSVTFRLEAIAGANTIDNQHHEQSV